MELFYPAGSLKVAARFSGADYPLKENLPAILAKRHLNRGIESIALSPDQQFIYFALQSPLDNPTPATYKQSRNVRLFKVHREDGQILSEYLYRIDRPDTFMKDNANKKPSQNDVKVSDMVAVGQDKLIVLERISKTTKFYQIDLAKSHPLAKSWDDEKLSPSLESVKTQPALNKKMMLNTDDIANAPDKLEGVAYVNPHLWYLINDNDFGIEGQGTHIVEVDF